MDVGELTYFTDDVDALVRFYGDLLGEPPVRAGDGIAFFEAGDVEVMIHEMHDPDDEPPPEDHVSFDVADVDETFERLRDRGLTAYLEPTDYPWGRSGYLRDPDGRLVELHERG